MSRLRVLAGVRESLAHLRELELSGASREEAAVALLTGLPLEKLRELGGVREVPPPQSNAGSHTT